MYSKSSLTNCTQQGKEKEGKLQKKLPEDFQNKKLKHSRNFEIFVTYWKKWEGGAVGN